MVTEVIFCGVFCGAHKYHVFEEMRKALSVRRVVKTAHINSYTHI